MLDQAGTPVHVFPPEVGVAVLVVDDCKVVVVVGVTVHVGVVEVEEVEVEEGDVEELGTEDPLQALTTDKVA